MATGTTYSYAQLEQLWIQNGGPAAVAPVAAAIALAESSGNSNAENQNDNGGKQTSWGLWQISNGTHSQPVANILDPNVNAAQAVAKYQDAGNSFTPWGTYNSGAYLSDVSNGTPPSSTGVPASTVTTAAVTVGAPVPGCMIAPPSFSVLGFTIGGGCILAKSEARALIGGSLMSGAAGIMLIGLVILTAAGFRASGAAAVVQAGRKLAAN